MQLEIGGWKAETLSRLRFLIKFHEILAQQVPKAAMKVEA